MWLLHSTILCIDCVCLFQYLEFNLFFIIFEIIIYHNIFLIYLVIEELTVKGKERKDRIEMMVYTGSM